MIKVFISQPMNGLTDEQIKEEREKIKVLVQEEYPNEEISILDSFFEGAPHDAKPLWFLGKSLQVLADADVAVFGPGWESARGCTIEHECAIKYGINTIKYNKKED